MNVDCIIPHMVTDVRKDGYELEIPYEGADGVNAGSTDAGELGKALHAGVIPGVYKDAITASEVKEVRRKAGDEEEMKEPARSVYGTEEEIKERAKGRDFVRDPERKLVYYPKGEILRQKCIKKDRSIRYANKNAWRQCSDRNKYYKVRNEWKEIDFPKDCLEKPCADWLKSEGKEADTEGASKGKYHFERRKVVSFF